MTQDEYETTIRPALARFCGWELVPRHGYDYTNKHTISMMWTIPDNPDVDYQAQPPDPLHNPADAWALQKSLVAWCDERGYDYQPRVRGCTITYTHPCSGIDWIAESSEKTSEAALVSVAWEVVRQTAERPSGE